MGLDMYLEGDMFLWTNWDNPKEGMRHKVAALFPEVGAEASNVTFQLGYWRKANAIHKWFVDNVQEGVDECQRSYVTKENLTDLLMECKLALEGNVGLLPPQSGFFFGGTERDQWYYEDLKKTIAICENALKFKGDIYYHSSW